MKAYVTGASQGIGREIALTLARQGHDVTAAARSDGIYETADLLEEGTGHILPIQTDIRDETSVQASIKQTADEFAGLDCLVNNAGISGPSSPIEEIDLQEWENTLSTNVTGMFLTVKHSVSHLRESENASIINISSISGKRPLEERAPYTTSKMAVIGLSRTLAYELGEDDIRVNSICPGATRGPRLDWVIEQQADGQGISFEEAKKQIESISPLHTMVEAEDIANMVAYLAGPNGRRITAQDINVSGGVAWF